MNFSEIAVPTLHSVTARHAHERPDAIAIVYGDRSHSYAGLDRLTGQIAQSLLRDGYLAGERIIIIGRNSDLFPLVALGANKAGLVPVPINWRLAPQEIADLVVDAQARVVFADDASLPMVKQMQEASGTQFAIISGSQIISGEWLADDPLAATGGDDPHATIVQVYTSGTTGQPKGVMLSHRSLLGINALRKSGVPWDTWGPDDVTLVSAPLGHVGAFGMMVRALFFGAATVIHDVFDAGAVLDAIARYKVSKLSLVPTAIKMVLDHPASRHTDYTHLDTIIYGASPINLELLKEAIAVFRCKFAQSYGMTETSGPVVALAPDDHDLEGSAMMRSAGQALPATAIKIIGEDGAEVPTGTTGEICIRSIANMQGYWNRPEETAATLLADGWLRTGDAGVLDENGYLTIKARVKEMIISGAENVYPAEVENAIFGHPAVSEVAVIGFPDAHWGEAVTAIVVLKPDHEPDPGAIQAWARERIAGYKVPKTVHFVEELPLNSSGKIDKRALKRAFDDAALLAKDRP